MIYFTTTRGDRYKLGLNTIHPDKKFDTVTKYGPGLYYATIEDIFWLAKEDTLVVLTLPSDARQVQVSKIDPVKFRSDKIEVIELRQLWILETFEYLCNFRDDAGRTANINANRSEVLHNAASAGRLDIIQYLHGRGLDMCRG
jgi:hypothetical protein